MVSMQKKTINLLFRNSILFCNRSWNIYILLLPSFKCVTHCDNILCMYFMDGVCDVNSCTLLLYSLGCGIGYGYLHRIPKRQFPSSKSSAVPSAPAPASVDGFAEVSSVMFISFWSVESRTVDSCTVLIVTGTLLCIFIENSWPYLDKTAFWKYK